jgi:hypothetical protein
VRKLAAAARVTSSEVTPVAPAIVTANNNVTLVSKQTDLTGEAMTVTADVIPLN